MARLRTNEFENFCKQTVEATSIAVHGFASSGQSLENAYNSALRFVFGIVGALALEARDIPLADELCQTLFSADLQNASWKPIRNAMAEFSREHGTSLLGPVTTLNLPAETALAALAKILPSKEGSTHGRLQLETIPQNWIAGLYEEMLNIRPVQAYNDDEIALQRDSIDRKKRGSFYTPPFIVDYIVSGALGDAESPSAARTLDPSMGTGIFLLRALKHLSQRTGDSVRVAENYIFGCDIDPIAVDIARHLIWLETDGKADTRAIARHLICADTLSGNDRFWWEQAFPEAFQLFPCGPGFEAVIGNPPYLAAKNGAIEDWHKVGRRVYGQSDYYLLFMESLIGNELVLPGGKLGIVLPDPFLIRENAARIRRKLLEDWTIDQILHIARAFPSAQVANVVLLCSNHRPENDEFSVVRLDDAKLRRRFEANPEQTSTALGCKTSRELALAQPRAEVLYLVDIERQGLFRRIHGEAMSISRVRTPFATLETLGARVLRGEEIGKKRIQRSEGELPILCGGQSISPYRITWEGNGISHTELKKPLSSYLMKKIVLQKSSGKLIAAFDTMGYVVPQSVYSISLDDYSLYNPLYVLALLNSRLLNAYAFCAFTGYKLVQPQFEMEDIRRLPIRTISFDLDKDERESLVLIGKALFQDGLSSENGFAALAETVRNWLLAGRDAAAHDLLVHLASLAIATAEDSQRIIASDVIHSAIDAVVESLYGVD